MTLVSSDLATDVVRREGGRLSIQTGAAGLAVLIISLITLIINGWPRAWELAGILARYWATFYVFRSFLAWHRIDKVIK